jgi:hypothetical protein
MTDDGGGRPRWIHEAMLRRPWCFCFWGNRRIAVNRAAFELAPRINPRFGWFELRKPEDPVDPDDPAVDGRIPDALLFRTVQPDDFQPDNATANLAMWSVIRADEPKAVLHPIMDFLRLPQLLQEAIGNASPEGRPAVFVVSNADRVVQYYPEDLTATRAVLDVFARERVAVMITLCDVVRADRFAYDFVFEVRAEPGADWREATIRCEKDPTGELAIGEAVSAFPRR